MQRSSWWRGGTLLLLAALLGLGVSACGRAPAAEDAEGGSNEATVEPVQGSEQSRVILTQRAAERLGIETAPVRTVRVAAPRRPAGMAGGPRAGATTRTVIPYAAVLYDEHGDTWAFTNPAPLSFIRKRIGVDYVRGDLAVLVKGPPAGTRVVTIGAAELLGAELGVGGE
jgi:hypothetical protein